MTEETKPWGGRQPGQKSNKGFRKGDVPNAWQEANGRWRAKRVVQGVPFVATGATKAEAVTRLLRKIEDGEPTKLGGRTRKSSNTADEPWTIDAWLWHCQDHWKDGLAPSTADQYRRVIEKMLEPDYRLTGRLLTEVDGMLIEAFRARLAEVATERTGKPLGRSRRKAIETRLKASLEYAVDLELLGRNPWPKQTDNRPASNRPDTEQPINTGQHQSNLSWPSGRRPGEPGHQR